jgi:CBS domain-containing protein
MRDRKIRRLPVVDHDGKLVGILAMNDLVLHSDRNGRKETAVPYDEVMTAFKGICDHHQLLTQQAAQA